MWFLAIWTFSFEKALFSSFAHFIIVSLTFFFWEVLGLCCLCWPQTLGHKSFSCFSFLSNWDYRQLN
jgi:hypothetical protein